METIKTIQELISAYKKLPGIGFKTAERLAHATLDLTNEEREDFINALTDANLNVHKCPNCGSYFEEACPVCSDPTRDNSLLLVVSSSKDILSIEKTNGYKGLYFSLKGTLSPLKNKTPDVIGIPQLKEQVAKNNTKEIILALPTDLEGETTALYIANIYKNNSDIHVSKLANGIPIGTNLEYLDNLTISSSIKGRIQLNKGDKNE